MFGHIFINCIIIKQYNEYKIMGKLEKNKPKKIIQMYKS